MGTWDGSAWAWEFIILPDLQEESAFSLGITMDCGIGDKEADG